MFCSVLTTHYDMFYKIGLTVLNLIASKPQLYFAPLIPMYFFVQADKHSCLFVFVLTIEKGAYYNKSFLLNIVISCAVILELNFLVVSYFR